MKRQVLWRGWIRVVGEKRWKWVMDCCSEEEERWCTYKMGEICKDKMSVKEHCLVSWVPLPPDETPTFGGILSNHG